MYKSFVCPNSKCKAKMPTAPANNAIQILLAQGRTPYQINLLCPKCGELGSFDIKWGMAVQDISPKTEGGGVWNGSSVTLSELP